MGIKKDFKAGSDGESTVAKLFEPQFFVNKNKLENLADWDLCCVENNVNELSHYTFTIEVKNDLYAAKSGNIALEFWNSRKNKAAGIEATKADLWAHIIPGSGVWITSVKKLKDYVAGHPSFRTIFSGGDGNADMYLYKMDEILPAIFIECGKLTPEKLRQTVEDLLE